MPHKVITGIYIIKNIKNNKVYIGSAKSILSRLSNHKYQLNKNKHFNKHLQSSYNKYGFGSFTFNILEETDLDNLQKLEEYYIKEKYKSNNTLFGYNKRIDCKTNLGLKYSEEHIENLRKSHIGNKHSEESKIKIAESRYKSIYKISDKLEILCKYKSILEASIDNNINSNSISACCRGKLNSSGGYYWSFVESYDKNKKYKKISKINKQKKFVYKNTLTNEVFFKLKDVSEQTGIKNTTLHNMFSGINKNKTNFIRYER
jgi:group I intron endonuclease